MRNGRRKLIAAIKVLALVLLSVPIITIGAFSVRKNVLHENYPLTFGLGHSVVISRSMEPTIKVGDLIFTRKQKSYKENDIITFYQDNMLVTHRIYEVTEYGYITWGDNKVTNTVPDREIKHEDVYGKVTVIMPKVGHVLNYFQTNEGRFVLIGLAVIGLLIVFYPTSNKDEKNEETKQKES